MTRLGYAALAMILVALGWYVLRPVQDTSVHWQHVYEGPIPTAYTIHAQGLTQQVTDKRVVIDGIALPLGEEKANGLWNQLQVLSAPADRLVKGVAPADYAAYGIDPSVRSIRGADFALAWGVADNSGYIVDQKSGTVMAFDPGVSARLDALCGRLDAEIPVPLLNPVAVTVGHERFVSRGAQWVAALSATRPSATARVRDLMNFINDLRLTDLAGTVPDRSGTRPEDSTEITRVLVEYPASEAVKAGYDPFLDIIVRADPVGGGGTWQATGWPAQPLNPLQVWRVRYLAAAFSEDRVFNLGSAIFGHGITAVAVTRGGQPWFLLKSSNARELDDLSSKWDVVWDGGREYADPTAADQLASALNGINVRAVRPRLVVEPAWPDAVQLRVTVKGQAEPIILEMRGRAVRSATHVGYAIELPELLADLRPDRFLDKVLASRAPERVVKLQRRLLDRTPAVEETFASDERGIWRRTFPAGGPVDQVMLQRLARAAAGGTATAVRLATAADRALADDPSVEIAVRFAPKSTGKANDYTDLEETTSIDLGLALGKRDGVWRALLLGGGIAYDLEADLVDLFTSDVTSPLIMPVVPALVSKIVLTGPPGQGDIVDLRMQYNGWMLMGDTKPVPAAEVEVRRLLRDISNLVATRRVEGLALVGNEVAATVTVTVPGSERDLTESMVMQIAAPGTLGAAADACIVFAESTRVGAMVRSRAMVPAAAVAGFAPDRARYHVAP